MIMCKGDYERKKINITRVTEIQSRESDKE